jgi:hypothetical protein
VPPDRARALVCAAVRETFEESGVLLAGASHDDLVRDSAALAADRHALLAGSASLTEVLARRGLVLRTDLLTPWARWITPEASPRRFDTWFFVAALPPWAGRHGGAGGFRGPCRPGESESGAWLRPASALEAARAGQMTLLPPTAVTLGELAGIRRAGHPGSPPGHHAAAAQADRRGRAGAAGAAPVRQERT